SFVIARSEATKQSILTRGELWIASPSLSSGAHSRDPLARNDDKPHLRLLAARCARGLQEPSALSIQRAQGMTGARCARSRAWSVVNTRVSHRGHTGKRPAFPAQWFYGLFRALPGDRACLPPSSAEMASANLMPASGHQDHTTSPSASSALSSLAPPASIASRPAAVTIACRPSVGRDGGGYRSDLGQERTGIFLREGLDTGIAEQPVGQIREGAELALHPGISSLPPQRGRIFAGTHGLHTSFLMASIFRSRPLNCGRSMSACDSVADSNHARRHVRKVPDSDIDLVGRILIPVDPVY